MLSKTSVKKLQLKNQQILTSDTKGKKQDKTKNCTKTQPQ